MVGVGVGTAAAAAIEPLVEPGRQEAWSNAANRVLDPGLMARLVAQGAVTLTVGRDQAAREGFAEDKFDRLVYLSQHAPELADARSMHRRTTIDTTRLHHVYAKAQIEASYWPALDELLTVMLSPAEVAMAIQQGHLPDPGILPGIGAESIFPAGYTQPPSPDGGPPSQVPLTQIELDPIAEAAAAGIDVDRLKVQANLSGLPPGPHDLLQMWNRSEVDEQSVDAGLREGHLKTKWAQAFKRMRWAVLSPQEYASARLRQWVTADESYAGGALTGHTREQMDLLFLNRGRPASPTQMWRAWARKAIGPRGVPTEYEDHAKAIAISDIRPEYAEMLWQIRFNYPSLFQLNRLVQAGAITPATASEWANDNLYAPEVVTALEAYWQTLYPGGTGTTAAKPDAHVTKAQTQLWTATHKSYVGEMIGDSEARQRLAELGADTAAVDAVLTLWQSERALIRKQLTPKQVVNAYLGKLTNPATGQTWTQGEANQELLDRGYSQDDATTLLAEG